MGLLGLCVLDLSSAVWQHEETPHLVVVKSALRHLELDHFIQSLDEFWTSTWPPSAETDVWGYKCMYAYSACPVDALSVPTPLNMATTSARISAFRLNTCQLVLPPWHPVLARNSWHRAFPSPTSSSWSVRHDYFPFSLTFPWLLCNSAFAGEWWPCF